MEDVYADRLSRFRANMRMLGVDGFVLEIGDEHLSEYVAPHAERIAWLTGFAGSAGKIVVLIDRAAIFVDGRYTGLVRQQVDAGKWAFVDEPAGSVTQWIRMNAACGARIGYDARLLPHARAVSMAEALREDGCEFVGLTNNPVDLSWSDQPTRPSGKAFALSVAYSGKTTSQKRQDVTDWLNTNKLDACVLVALDSIAWLLNLRGSDLATAPLNYGFALCYADGGAELFIDLEKVDEPTVRSLGDDMNIAAYGAFYGRLSELEGLTVAADPNRSPAAVYRALENAGAVIKPLRDPIVMAKAIKNPVEIDGFRNAHLLDGVSLTSFLHWFAREAPKGQLTELAAAAKLTAFRQQCEDLKGISFTPISAVDGNAAMPHYSPTKATDTAIGPGSIYLIDSGGQYLSGTTDVTRTLAVGTPSNDVRARFTQVLKAHVVLARARFPHGTLGSQIDAITRAPLWDVGIECTHGIGHGVGHFSNVHEGPVYLAKPRPNEDALSRGMVLSNEPGYYEAGKFGIRIENLVVVVDATVNGGTTPTLGFETLTLAPFDRALIIADMLDRREIDWIDEYHAMVWERLSPHLCAEVQRWLRRETRPLHADLHDASADCPVDQPAQPISI
ncbi:aminopeptidase P family protein (plasmid) [Novosphingobium resinovorum]|uniref:aminopeptidase P family protein n=1 Tax=Novosphingobium TaxID=165696 RepID=UPI001B3C69C6|nr:MULTISPECIES: aminopeptidase P family protein [Novosphingobium]MBF7015276.1 aminopeptidase P family protein [Novosphingobium sp. HR1a]WJM29952.1 aminopeptidase P family protein [Novosphingobium resinovorum]